MVKYLGIRSLHHSTRLPSGRGDSRIPFPQESRNSQSQAHAAFSNFTVSKIATRLAKRLKRTKEQTYNTKPPYNHSAWDPFSFLKATTFVSFLYILPQVQLQPFFFYKGGILQYIHCSAPCFFH